MILVTCLLLLVALGLAERVAGWRARRLVPIRIHVNGTRGKSTVARLIAAALRETGVPTLAKVTGTAPRLIHLDGTDRPIARHAPANIHEQAWLLRRAARHGARAVVAECMAVRPDLQWASEREFVHATIGVITNVRLDHTDVMGRTLEEIAASLANAIPRRAVLVAGEPRFGSLLEARCAAVGTRLVMVDPRTPLLGHAETGDMPDWLREDVRIALAVTRELGIEDAVAIRGMRRAAPDPGAFSTGTATLNGHGIAWVDATAANDPASLDFLIASAKLPSTSLPSPQLGEPRPTAQGFRPGEPCRASGAPSTPQPIPGPRALICVYNHRADRADRLRTFAAASSVFRSSQVILVTGDRPAVSLAAAVRRMAAGRDIRFLASGRLVEGLAGAVRKAAGSSGQLIVFCGNTRGFTNPLGGSCSKAP